MSHRHHHHNLKVNQDENILVERDHNSSSSEDHSDSEYELQAIKLQVYGSSSSLSRRKRRKCCTVDCWIDNTKVWLAFAAFYIFCGLFTWALIEAALANTDSALITFAVIWVVSTITFLILVFYFSNKKLKEKEAHAELLQQEELIRKKEIKEALDKQE